VTPWQDDAPDHGQLGQLTAHDWSLLTAGARRTVHRRGDVILAEGAAHRNLFIVRQGLLHVEQARQGQGIAVAQVGPGEIFGEMALLENTVASASIVAQEDAEIDVVDEAHLQTLLTSEPGFAVRFYHSLTINLSRRLRIMMQRVAASSEESQRIPSLLHTGNITARQIPEELRTAVDTFETTLLRVDQDLRKGSLAGPSAQHAVTTACDTLLSLLSHYTGSAALVEIGWDELLAFRDTPQLETGLGDFVFRETFGKFMLSATLARCFTWPRGVVNDFEVADMIDADQADGDDRLGPYIDRWFLSRPYCQGRRNGRRLISALIKERARTASEAAPLLLTALGSGVAREVLDLFQRPDPPAVYATLLEADHAALSRSRDVADALGCRDSLNYVLADVTALAAGTERLALPPQGLIYVLGLCDIMADDALVAVLDWAHHHLVPGGVVVMSTLPPGHPDRALLEYIVHWPLLYRAEEDVEALIRRSRFGAQPIAMERDETRTLVLSRCAKGA
jgi:CRP-like cAMP-binding protein